ANPPVAPRVESAAQEVTHQVGAPCQAGATHPQNTPPMPPSPAAKQVESKLPHRHVPSQPNPPAAPRVNAPLKRLIWQKARNKCENCHSRYALEIDHRIPRALGGPNTPENLRLLCRSCNQRAAIQALGLRKMEPHLGKGL
ncbi:MAG: HNH endonuclease, partial [Bdellovibrionales bacterium]|nr:HNH endonuclease [Bdellovibrionales bacterium]